MLFTYPLFTRFRSGKSEIDSSSPTTTVEPSTPLVKSHAVDTFLHRGKQPAATPTGEVDKEALPKVLLFLATTLGIRHILNLRFLYDNQYEVPHPKHLSVFEDGVKQFNQQAAQHPDVKPLSFTNIPMDAGQGVSVEQAKAVLDFFERTPKQEPVYVHCKEGKDRTGIAVALYRMLYSPEQTFADIVKEMQAFGHNTQGLFWGLTRSLAYVAQHTPLLKPFYQRHQQEVDAYLETHTKNHHPPATLTAG